MRSIGVVTLTLGVLLAASSASAKKIEVPGDHATIQEAVDAASDGDEIRVSGGPYAGTVAIIDRTNLTLKGKGSPVVQAFFIQRSTDVSLSGFAVEGSSSHGVLIVDSSDVTVRKCAIRNTAQEGVRTEGCSRVEIEKNVLEDIGLDGVLLSPDGGEPTNDSVVAKNTFRNIGDWAIEANGSDSGIVKNDVDGCWVGILVRSGTRNVVRKNRVENSRDDAYQVYADGNTFEKNEATGVGDDAYEVESCAGNVLTKNEATDVTEVGFQLYEATGNRLEKNTVTRSGNEAFGVWTGCTGNDLVKNKVKGAAVGIVVEDSGNVFQKNRIKETDGHGVWLTDGSANEFEKNEVKGAGGCGFRVESCGNTFFKNRAKKSRDADLRDSAGSNSYEGNSFDPPPSGT